METVLLKLNSADLTVALDITKKEVFPTPSLLPLILLTSANTVCSTYAILLFFEVKVCSHTIFHTTRKKIYIMEFRNSFSCFLKIRLNKETLRFGIF